MNDNKLLMPAIIGQAFVLNTNTTGYITKY